MDRKGFKVRFNEPTVHGQPDAQPLSNGRHVRERVAWLAFSV